MKRVVPVRSKVLASSFREPHWLEFLWFSWREIVMVVEGGWWHELGHEKEISMWQIFSLTILTEWIGHSDSVYLLNHGEYYRYGWSLHSWSFFTASPGDRQETNVTFKNRHYYECYNRKMPWFCESTHPSGRPERGCSCFYTVPPNSMQALSPKGILVFQSMCPWDGIILSPYKLKGWEISSQGQGLGDTGPKFFQSRRL